MSKRPDTQKAAEAAYREKFVSVLVRYTPEEAALLDRARGAASRPEYAKQKSLEAARRGAAKRSR